MLTPTAAAIPDLPPRSFFTLLARPLLARLLGPFESPLATRGFSVSALAASAADDRTLPHALYDLLDAAHAQLTSSTNADAAARAAALPLLPLLESLSSIHRASTPAARDALIKLDTARVLPSRLGPEDLAATAYLDHPALFAALRVAPAADAVKNFVLYEAAPGATPRFDRDALDATQRALGAWFDARHRSAVCEIHARHRDGEIHFEITHGKTPVTHEVIDESLSMRVVTQVNAQRSYAVYSERTRVLAVHALEYLKDGIRRSFGLGCGGSEECFVKAGALIDAAPLLDLDASLAPDPELGVTAIALRWMDVTAADGAGASYWSGKGDVRATSQNAPLRAALAAEGASVTYVKLAIEIAHAARTLLVEITPPRNQLVYDRRDPRVAQTLLAWLTSRGIWRGGDSREGAVDAVEASA